MNPFLTPRSSRLFAFTTGLLAAGSMSVATAQDVTLSDNTSVATVNLGGGTGLAGMNSWTIAGQSQLNQQWFWYRIGNDSSGQHRLDSLGAPTIVSQTANFIDARYDGSYSGQNFSIEISYTLQGGDTSGTNWSSDISETISIKNNSAAPLSMHFFQYSDFALVGSQGKETANIYQNGSFFSQATVTKVSALTQVSETIDQPLADHAEAAIANLPGNTLDRLNSGAPITLNDNNLNAGPDDVNDATWALEWDPTIAPGDSTDILKDKTIHVEEVPEPSSIGLLIGGALLLGLRRRG